MAASTITPVSLLTGFLGSGKTTLLNRLLRAPALADTAVLINEFGAVSLDHLLVRESSENIAVLANGCVCCSVAGDMVQALRDLYFKRANGEVPPFSRVIIETTGLADPAPILHTLIEMPLVAARYALAGVITTVDATHADSQFDAHFEAVKQVAVADRIVITKTDLCDADQLAALTARIRALNPAATLLTSTLTQSPEDAVAQLFDAGLSGIASARDDGAQADVVRNWLRAERYHPINNNASVHSFVGRGTTPRARHDERISAFTLSYLVPLDWDHVVDALEVLIAIRGDQLLRFKALVHCEGEQTPRVLHAVQHSVYPWSSLPSWPPGEPKSSRLVFITRDLDPHFIRDTFNQYLQAQCAVSAENA